MNSENLFNIEDDYQMKAYMSSALTSFPRLSPEDEDKLCKEVMDLNVTIKELCHTINIDLYLPQESSNPRSSHDDGLTPEEVYLLDRWRVVESNFLIMNANELGFGVGQEIEIANNVGIPVIVFFKSHLEVSRMLKGSTNVFVPHGFSSAESFITYKDENDLLIKLKDRILIIKSIFKKTNKDIIHKESFSKKLIDIRGRKNISIEDLAHKTGLSLKFIKLLETEKHYFEELASTKNLRNTKFKDIDLNKFTNPGLWILNLLKDALGVDFGELLPVKPIINYEPVDYFAEACRELDLDSNTIFYLTDHFQYKLLKDAARGDIIISKEIMIQEIKKIIDNV